MTLPPSRLLARRQARLRPALDALDVEALVITNGTNIRYLTNHVGSAGILVITAEAAYLAVDFRYREAIRLLQASPAACPGLEVWDVPTSYDEALLDGLARLAVTRVGFEAGHVSVARHAWWRQAAASRRSGLEFCATERAVEQLRLIKDDFEVAALREGARRLGAVAAAGMDAARVGRTERGVAAAVEDGLRHAGFERPAFETIVASGPNAALPHYRAGDRVLAAGDLVVLDFGGVLDGYCCDLTRTVAIGEPGAQARHLYEAVHAAHAAAVAAVRSGVLASAVDAAARTVLEERGLGHAFGHGTGHGLGLEVHEEPRVSQRRADVAAVTLAAGMVITIEPGAYLSGFGGVRLEDDVLVTEAGAELLTSVPRELRVC